MHDPILDILLATRVLIARGWTQGAQARREKRIRCDRSDYRATAWCLVGALYRAVDDLGYDENCRKAARRLLNGRTGGTIIWNDCHGRTHDEVLAMLDWAIVLRRAAFSPQPRAAEMVA